MGGKRIDFFSWADLEFLIDIRINSSLQLMEEGTRKKFSVRLLERKALQLDKTPVKHLFFNYGYVDFGKIPEYFKF